MVLYIQTSRMRYVIHLNGDIERTDMYSPPSEEWKMLGLISRKRSKIKEFIPLPSLTKELVASLNLKDWMIRDLDHGTVRDQGDNITSITFFQTPEETPYYRNNRELLRQNHYFPPIRFSGNY